MSLLRRRQGQEQPKNEPSPPSNSRPVPAGKPSKEEATNQGTVTNTNAGEFTSFVPVGESVNGVMTTEEVGFGYTVETIKEKDGTQLHFIRNAVGRLIRTTTTEPPK